MAKERLQEALERIQECRRTGSAQLDLAGFELRTLPDAVRKLRQLQALLLAHNSLTALPAWIGELRELRILELQGNPLKRLPSNLSRLQKLESLGVASGDIPMVLPESLRDLSNLRELVLHGLQLVEVPEFIRRLPRLQFLYLKDNDLQALPAWLADLPLLEALNISDNPRLGLPAEIADQGNARNILDYYFRIRGGASLPLNEFKLILIGRGGVGKTSLVHRLISNDFKEFRRTPGILIKDWSVEIDNDNVREGRGVPRSITRGAGGLRA
jgi:internalin A